MKFAIIGDYNHSFHPHKATNEAINHSFEKLQIQADFDWISTETIEVDFKNIIAEYAGFWIAPGSPYKSFLGVLKLIRFARENKIPTLGTCGGFQHMVIEYARNVLHIIDAEHAEYDPYSSKLVISPLSCSLAGQVLDIDITDKSSKIYQIYKTNNIKEKYYCNFGLNPEYQQKIHDCGFKIVGQDGLKEARILELNNHPFFIATLFVPQDNSTINKPHKLVTEFLQAVLNTKIP